MANEQTQELQKHKDFFISYTGVDHTWAEWIAWHLEQEGYTTIIQAWDFLAGGNFVQDMDRATKQAERTIAVLSPDYFRSRFTPAEWQEAFRRDPTSEDGKLLPIRVRSCDVQGLLGPLVYIDLVNLDEHTAREQLLTRVRHERAKPATAPTFPGVHPPTHPSVPPPTFPGARNRVWTVPHPRNSLFTGREAELQAIEDALKSGQNAAIEAISGLGGIGKTQLALEYAYRHRQEYRYIFWALADTRETLSAAYLTLAELLDLPGKSQPEQRYIIEAVKSWLEKTPDWLLILDNADDLEILHDFLPTVAGGRILLTTRAHAYKGLAKGIEIKKLPDDKGVHFLLLRSGTLSESSDPATVVPGERAAAQEIVHELDGLPLALDQAGAYIEETSCGLQGYLKLYRKERKELLKTRGGLVIDHPDSVATTWKLAFEKIEKANPAAADLLRFCAFLAPDDIPELLIVEGEAELTSPLKKLARNPLKLNAAIAELQKYSLVSRDPIAQTLSLHRLVQVVLHDAMMKNVERAWVVRVVRTMERAFPWAEDVTKWGICGQLLPHARECVALIGEWQVEMFESGGLLNSVGWYLYTRAEYSEAQLYLEKALAIAQKICNKRAIAGYLNNLANVYREQGKYEEAVTSGEQALAIQRKVLGEEHPDTSMSLSNLGLSYQYQEEYAEAEPLYRQALAIQRDIFSEEHPNIARILNNFGELYHAQEKYAEADGFYQQALSIDRKVLGEIHPNVAHIMNNLGKLSADQGKYQEALPFFEQALAIRQEKLGAEHPDTKKTRESYEETLRKLEEEKQNG